MSGDAGYRLSAINTGGRASKQTAALDLALTFHLSDVHGPASQASLSEENITRLHPGRRWQRLKCCTDKKTSIKE